jgi:glutamate-1-semialdehyde 2,1-aminomutase
LLYKGGFEMSSNKETQKYYEQAIKVMPGPHSNLRAMASERPIFIVKGRGAHLWNIEGKEFIDFTMGAGAGVFGYSHEEYIQALKDQIDSLYYLVTGAAQTPMEIELAGKFVQHVPCAEKVRFCLSGTEAVQLAIRLARAYTKRPYFVRFEGHYHGWLDNVLGGMVDDNAVGRPFAVESDHDPMKTEGKGPGAFEQSLKLPWNDIGVLEKVLEKYGKEIAMILMEPITCNSGCCPPRSGYLERVRELCTRHGIILCFDEVITGFRVALNCAQGVLGVTPDIATFGKAMAGGIPMGAVAGKKEILDLLLERRVIGAGTFNGYPLGVSGSLAALRIYEKDNGAYYRKIDKLQNRLMNGLKEISREHGIPMLTQGIRGVFFYMFINKDVAYSSRDLKELDVEKQNRFRTLLAEEGILIMWNGRWYVSGGHTEGDIDKTLECADRAMNRL